jgi:hypothetical protein
LGFSVRPGVTAFRRACKLGLEGIVSTRKDSTSLRALAGLAQDEEPPLRVGEPGGGRGLGTMSHKGCNRSLSDLRRLD